MNIRNPLVIVSATASVVAVLTAYDNNLYYATTPLISLSVVLLCASLLDFGTEKKSSQEIDALRKQLHEKEINQRFEQIENSIYRESDSIRNEINHSATELREELRTVRSDVSHVENDFNHKIDNLVRDMSLNISNSNR